MRAPVPGDASFDAAARLDAVDYGVTSMTAPLRRVLVRRPATRGDFAGAAWREPDPAALARQHDEFCGLLASLGAEVEVADALDEQVDAVYMHDPLAMSARGGIALRMAKPARVREPDAAASELERLGIPLVGRITEPGYLDGGDRLWLDDSTVAVGLGYRTNQAGADQLHELLEPEGAGVLTYDLPHDQGPGMVLHLQSLISLITEDLAVVYEPLAPVRFLQELERRGIERIAIDHDDYTAMGCNILAVRPGVVVMVDGVPAVRTELERRGVEVHVYAGSELSLKGDGGPTCLTAPLLRAA